MNPELRYIYISNIPKAYHAYHLRNFFSQYVESATFVCFHFRHRPQLVRPSETVISSSDLVTRLKTKSRERSAVCGFLSMLKDPVDWFLKQYDRTHWLSPDDELPLPDQCILTPIQFDNESDYDAFLQLIEFKPPPGMPQGNVGTPTQHFFRQIQSCQLDSSIITKLKLNFSQRGTQRKYGAVPYCYDTQTSDIVAEEEENDQDAVEPLIASGDVRSRTGVRIIDDMGYADYLESKVDGIEMSPVRPSANDDHTDTDSLVNEQPPGPDEDEDEPCEDWERFEALHDDPYKLTRHDKANLKYEDKVELVWEKGSSGLVFHTDERTWRKLDPLRKEELFDEPASFDWDVDMEPYERPTEFSVGPTPTGHRGQARDTSDLIDIQRDREAIDLAEPGLDAAETFHRETYGKGYGVCLMRRLGWKPGTKLGPRNTMSRTRGLLYPLELEDHHTLAPRVRTGLGFYGPTRTAPYAYCMPSQPTNTVYIRSVFDSPDTVARRSGLGLTKSLLRRDDPQLVLKYRPTSTAEAMTCQSASTSSSAGFVPRNRTVILNPSSSLSKEGIAFVSGGFLHPEATSEVHR